MSDTDLVVLNGVPGIDRGIWIDRAIYASQAIRFPRIGPTGIEMTEVHWQDCRPTDEFAVRESDGAVAQVWFYQHPGWER